jgi:hypothetical protein
MPTPEQQKKWNDARQQRIDERALADGITKSEAIRRLAVDKAAERAARPTKPSMPNTGRLTEEERKQRRKAAHANVNARRKAEREELGLTTAQYNQYKKGKSLDEIRLEAEIKKQRKEARAKDEDDLLSPGEQQILIDIINERFAPNVIARAHTREPRAQAVLKLAQALIEQGKQEDSGDLHRAGVALAFYRSPEEKRTAWMDAVDDSTTQRLAEPDE